MQSLISQKYLRQSLPRDEPATKRTACVNSLAGLTAPFQHPCFAEAIEQPYKNLSLFVANTRNFNITNSNQNILRVPCKRQI